MLFIRSVLRQQFKPKDLVPDAFVTAPNTAQQIFNHSDSKCFADVWKAAAWTSLGMRVNCRVSEASERRSGNRLFVGKQVVAQHTCDSRNYLFSGVTFRLLELQSAEMRKTGFNWTVQNPGVP